jgi:hypothetical protein
MNWFKRLADLFSSPSALKEPEILNTSPENVIMDKTQEINQWLLEQEDTVELSTLALYRLAPMSNVKHGEFVPGQDGCKVMKRPKEASLSKNN